MGDTKRDKLRVSIEHFIKHQTGIEKFNDFCSIDAIASPKFLSGNKTKYPNQSIKHARSKLWTIHKENSRNHPLF